MNERFQNLKNMHIILWKTIDLMKNLEKDLQDWKALRPDIKKMIKYYESKKWFEDVELYNQWKIPSNIPTWALSEDWIWNAIWDEYDIAKEIQKIAKEVTKR